MKLVVARQSERRPAGAKGFYSPFVLFGFACFLRLHLGPSAMILSLCLNAAGESPPLAPTPPLPPFYSTSPPCTWFTTLGFTTLPSGSYTSLSGAQTPVSAQLPPLNAIPVALLPHVRLLHPTSFRNGH